MEYLNNLQDALKSNDIAIPQNLQPFLTSATRTISTATEHLSTTLHLSDLNVSSYDTQSNFLDNQLSEKIAQGLVHRKEIIEGVIYGYLRDEMYNFVLNIPSILIAIALIFTFSITLIILFSFFGYWIMLYRERRAKQSLMDVLEENKEHIEECFACGNVQWVSNITFNTIDTSFNPESIDQFSIKSGSTKGNDSMVSYWIPTLNGFDEIDLKRYNSDHNSQHSAHSTLNNKLIITARSRHIDNIEKMVLYPDGNDINQKNFAEKIHHNLKQNFFNFISSHHAQTSTNHHSGFNKNGDIVPFICCRDICRQINNYNGNFAIPTTLSSSTRSSSQNNNSSSTQSPSITSQPTNNKLVVKSIKKPLFVPTVSQSLCANCIEEQSLLLRQRQKAEDVWYDEQIRAFLRAQLQNIKKGSDDKNSKDGESQKVKTSIRKALKTILIQDINEEVEIESHIDQLVDIVDIPLWLLPPPPQSFLKDDVNVASLCKSCEDIVKSNQLEAIKYTASIQQYYLNGNSQTNNNIQRNHQNINNMSNGDKELPLSRLSSSQSSRPHQPHSPHLNNTNITHNQSQSLTLPSTPLARSLNATGNGITLSRSGSTSYKNSPNLPQNTQKYNPNTQNNPSAPSNHQMIPRRRLACGLDQIELGFKGSTPLNRFNERGVRPSLRQSLSGIGKNTSPHFPNINGSYNNQHNDHVDLDQSNTDLPPITLTTPSTIATNPTPTPLESRHFREKTGVRRGSTLSDVDSFVGLPEVIPFMSFPQINHIDDFHHPTTLPHNIQSSTHYTDSLTFPILAQISILIKIVYHIALIILSLALEPIFFLSFVAFFPFIRTFAALLACFDINIYPTGTYNTQDNPNISVDEEPTHRKLLELIKSGNKNQLTNNLFVPDPTKPTLNFYQNQFNSIISTINSYKTGASVELYPPSTTIQNITNPNNENNNYKTYLDEWNGDEPDDQMSFFAKMASVRDRSNRSGSGGRGNIYKAHDTVFFHSHNKPPHHDNTSPTSSSPHPQQQPKSIFMKMVSDVFSIINIPKRVIQKALRTNILFALFQFSCILFFFFVVAVFIQANISLETFITHPSLSPAIELGNNIRDNFDTAKEKVEVVGRDGLGYLVYLKSIIIPQINHSLQSFTTLSQPLLQQLCPESSFSNLYKEVTFSQCGTVLLERVSSFCHAHLPSTMVQTITMLWELLRDVCFVVFENLFFILAECLTSLYHFSYFIYHLISALFHFNSSPHQSIDVNESIDNLASMNFNSNQGIGDMIEQGLKSSIKTPTVTLPSLFSLIHLILTSPSQLSNDDTITQSTHQHDSVTFLLSLILFKMGSNILLISFISLSFLFVTILAQRTLYIIQSILQLLFIITNYLTFIPITFIVTRVSNLITKIVNSLTWDKIKTSAFWPFLIFGFIFVKIFTLIYSILEKVLSFCVILSTPFITLWSILVGLFSGLSDRLVQLGDLIVNGWEKIQDWNTTFAQKFSDSSKQSLPSFNGLYQASPPSNTAENAKVNRSADVDKQNSDQQPTQQFTSSQPSSVITPQHQQTIPQQRSIIGKYRDNYTNDDGDDDDDYNQKNKQNESEIIGDMMRRNQISFNFDNFAIETHKLDTNRNHDTNGFNGDVIPLNQMSSMAIGDNHSRIHHNNHLYANYNTSMNNNNNSYPTPTTTSPHTPSPNNYNNQPQYNNVSAYGYNNDNNNHQLNQTLDTSMNDEGSIFAHPSLHHTNSNQPIHLQQTNSNYQPNLNLYHTNSSLHPGNPSAHQVNIPAHHGYQSSNSFNNYTNNNHNNMPHYSQTPSRSLSINVSIPNNSFYNTHQQNQPLLNHTPRGQYTHHHNNRHNGYDYLHNNNQYSQSNNYQQHQAASSDTYMGDD